MGTLTSTQATTAVLTGVASHAGNIANPHAVTAEQVGALSTGNLPITVSNLDVTLTAAEFSNNSFDVAGALTADVSIIIPNGVAQSFIVDNRTTGGFILSVKHAGTIGAVVVQNISQVLYTNGITVEAVVAAATAHTHVKTDITDFTHTHAAVEIVDFQPTVTANTSVVANTAHAATTTNPHQVTTYQVNTTDVRVKGVIDGQRTGVLVPMYIYPANIFTNVDYNALIKSVKENPDISFHIILNPASGAGAAVDANYARAIGRLRGAGAYVYGYVATGYGTPVNPVDAEVDKWASFYGVLDGIFFDELANTDTQAMRDQYKAYKEYAHSLGFYTAIGNSGATVPSTYFLQDVMDIIVTSENATYPPESIYLGDWADSYMELSKYRRAAIVYGQATLDPVGFALIKKYNGMVYVTSGVLPSPWSTLPAYFDEMVTALNPVGSGGGATGGGTDKVFYENEQVVSTDYTLTAGTNAMSTGLITVNAGVTVTVPTGSKWVIL